MSDAFAVVIEGLSEAIASVDAVPADVLRAARRAVNKATDRTRAQSAREMREQVAFPARYLSGQNGRLQIAKRPTAADLEGVIRGRHRPTSLARFARSKVPNSRRGVSVEVKPGLARFMRRAFLMRLPQGSTLTDTQANLGLALRLKPGERIQNKRQMVSLGGNLYLLYGPSVDQVFRTVSEDVAPDAAAFLETEFLRLLRL